MSEDVSHVPVTVRLLKVQRVAGRGDLSWLFSAVIEIAGVELTVQGFQSRTAGGRLSIRLPHFRSNDGRWVPAVVLPPGIMSAVSDVFVEEIGRPDLAGKGRSAPDG